MYRMLFEDPNNPEREEILNIIGFDDKDVIECTVKYALTLAYLMTTEESMDELVESIKTSALEVREQAMKANKRNLN